MMQALSVVDYILTLDPDTRRRVFEGLSEEERGALAAQIEERQKFPLYRWRNNHLGFVKSGLGEGIWSKQAEVLQAVDRHRKVVVVATHNIGKSHISARVVLGTGTSWPPGLARVTTTATNYRQVANILWPYIRRTHYQYELPGEVLASPIWRIGNELIADGFSAKEETGVQGLHANGELLLVVDEAGGISDALGTAFNSLLTGDGAHALVIGNAPTEREGSWFQRICEDESWHVITISAFDTPNFPRPGGKSLRNMDEVRYWLKRAEENPDDPEVQGMYEVPDRCTTCPPTIAAHTVAKHLTSVEWVDGIEKEFGPDSAYYIARVLAQFPKNVSSKTLPLAWLEAARVDGEEWELAKLAVTAKPIRLGVDVASGGGDELAIARIQGLTGEIVATSSGAEIGSAIKAARFILNQIELAELFHAEQGIEEPVRLKIDAIGIGWGVLGLLEEYKEQGRHNAELIGVNVAERASEPEKYMNQRAELWWRMREWIEPNEKTGETLGKLHLSDKELAQLNAPQYAVRNGRIQIEEKQKMKDRGQKSPDRAEAILLAFFEPPVHKIETPLAVPSNFQENAFSSELFQNL